MHVQLCAWDGVWTLMVFRCQSHVHFWKSQALFDRLGPWLYKLWGIEVEYSNSLLSFLLPSSPQHNRFFHPTPPRLYSLTMRFSAVVAFLGAAASVSASTIVSRQLPDCAMTCLTSAPTGTCSATDNACLCRNEEFIAAATTCISTTCQGDDLTTALTVAQAMCANEGVTLGAPGATTSGASTTGAPATTSGATTSAPTNTAPSTTTSGSNPAQTTSGAMSRGLSSVAALAAIALAAVSL